MREGDLLAALQIEAGRLGGVLWRNNSGVAFYPDGSRVKYGVGDGGSDLIGNHANDHHH